MFSQSYDINKTTVDVTLVFPSFYTFLGFTFVLGSPLKSVKYKFHCTCGMF
jgi:hypothetical protein